MAKFKASKGFHFSEDGRPWAHFKPRHVNGVGTVYELETDDPALIDRLHKVAADNPDYGIHRSPEPEAPQTGDESDSGGNGDGGDEDSGSGEDSAGGDGSDGGPARSGRGKSGA